MQAPHLIDLQDIVVHTIIDTSKVGERFTRSLDTYSSHAHAQRIIAENLAAMLAGSAPADCREVIELGSGTGLFTRAWSRLLNPQRARFFDLCRMPVYGVCEREEYFTGDAEQAVAQLAADQPLSVDAILSASAIQWFANHQRFFSNCHRLLKPEGLLAISTFAPGNLPELCRLRPDPMYYPSAETIRSYLSDFQRVEVRQEEVEIDFTSPMEALRHLRLTGVTGSGAQAGAAGVRRFVREYPQNSRGRYSLTFKPIYILARK